SSSSCDRAIPHPHTFPPRRSSDLTVSLGQFGPAPDRDSFAGDLMRNFGEEVARWRTYGLEPTIARWQSVGHPQGSALTLHEADGDRKSTRLNSSHVKISYAVFCFK